MQFLIKDGKLLPVMQILAVNPWIYDFAAYDFWLKPYGFLVILSYLKRLGAQIDFIDCLDKKITIDRFGRGKYFSQIIEKPEPLKLVPRYFKRYGITPEEFRKKVPKNKPDFILITSSMTYWYPGIIKAVEILEEIFPSTPVILGGTYTTLCLSHAKKNIHCEEIFPNNGIEDFFKKLGIELDKEKLFSTLPNYQDYYKTIDYAVLRTSWGCPFNCSYCAIKKLHPEFFRISEKKILSFIIENYQTGISDFVFYDDALLYENHYIKTLLKEIIKLKLKIRFHTPNALHLRFLDQETACLIKESGFTNPHFGLETLDSRLQKEWGNKVSSEEVREGVKCLKKAGFKNGEFSMYLLLGYPGQDLERLKKDAEYLNNLGAKISLAEFSITPGTKIFQSYKDEFAEPLLQNNSIFLSKTGKDLNKFYEIKNLVRGLNQKFSLLS